MPDSEIASITAVGSGSIARLETASHTYVANGFAMHNSVNEFRAQLADQAQTFMPRTESEARVASLTEKVNIATADNAERIRQVELRLQVMPTTAERDAVNTANLAFHTAVSERVNALELRVTSQLQSSAGRAAGLNAGWAYLLGTVGALGTIVSVILALIVLRH